MPAGDPALPSADRPPGDDAVPRAGGDASPEPQAVCRGASVARSSSREVLRIGGDGEQRLAATSNGGRSSSALLV